MTLLRVLVYKHLKICESIETYLAIYLIHQSSKPEQCDLQSYGVIIVSI